jgi:hypothetical protein
MLPPLRKVLFATEKPLTSHQLTSFSEKKPPVGMRLTLAAFGSVDIFKEAEPIRALHGIAILINSHTPFRFPSHSGKT